MLEYERSTVRWMAAGWLCGLAALASGCGPANGWVMNNSGLGYYQQGNYALARHEFAVAVAENPWNADYRHNLALSLKQLGDTGTAERILRHNLSVNAMHQPTYHSLAQIMNDTGRQGEAFELVQTWVESQPYVAGAHIEMAWLDREIGNTPDAERELRQALQIEPQNSIALANLGQIYQDAGQPMQAAALYQRSLALRPGQPQIETRLAAISPDSMGPAGHSASGPAAMQMAYRTTALPPPAFGGSMPVGPQGGMLAMQPMPAGPPMMTSQPMITSQSGPMTIQQSSVPMETIILPPESGPMLSSPAGPQLGSTNSAPVILSAPISAPSSGWQPVMQGTTAKSLNADPAHVPDMSALPLVTPR